MYNTSLVFEGRRHRQRIVARQTHWETVEFFRLGSAEAKIMSDNEKVVTAAAAVVEGEVSGESLATKHIAKLSLMTQESGRHLPLRSDCQ